MPDAAPEQPEPLPFAAFQASRQQMSAKAFGDLVGDAQWEDDETTQFLVYDDSWYIEICDDGRRMLTIENMGWIEPESSLEEMEQVLFDFRDVPQEPDATDAMSP